MQSFDNRIGLFIIRSITFTLLLGLSCPNHYVVRQPGATRFTGFSITDDDFSGVGHLINSRGETTSTTEKLQLYIWQASVTSAPGQRYTMSRCEAGLLTRVSLYCTTFPDLYNPVDKGANSTLTVAGPCRNHHRLPDSPLTEVKGTSHYLYDKLAPSRYGVNLTSNIS